MKYELLCFLPTSVKRAEGTEKGYILLLIASLINDK